MPLGAASLTLHPPACGAPSDEQAFLQAYDASPFDRVSVTVDIVVLAAAAEGLQALLIRRREHPFKGRWALPGGFVRVQETLEEASARVLAAKAGLRDLTFRQFQTFGEPDRDPRMRIVSVGHLALVEAARLQEAALRDGACAVARLEAGPGLVARDDRQRPLDLAFDHARILQAALAHLQGGLDRGAGAFGLLPPAFTMSELQRVHEAILGRPLNKDSFRRRMLAAGALEATGELQDGVEHRPAALFRARPGRRRP